MPAPANSGTAAHGPATSGAAVPGAPNSGPATFGAAGRGPATAQAGTPEAAHPPWTNAGDYLRAAATDEAPARFGTPPGSAAVDEYARRVWHHAFRLAVRRRFDPDTSLAEISRSVANAVHAHESVKLPAIDAEMLVRAELGEAVPVDEMEPAVRTGVHLLVFASLVDELALGDGELDDLVTRAEQFAAAT
jgi:hypothetical protein